MRAGAEVILAASSINSPKLLMLSGIGPAAHLAEHGIPVLADRPGVGANLQDHLEIYMQFAACQPITLFKYWNLWGKALIGAQWLFTGKGLGAVQPVRSLRLHPVARGVDYPTSSIISCPSPCAMMARPPPRATGFRPMSARCGPNRAGRSRCGRPARRRRRVIRSTTCRTPTTGRISAPASA
jgi:choline dehydrogenase